MSLQKQRGEDFVDVEAHEELLFTLGLPEDHALRGALIRTDVAHDKIRN